VGLGKSVVQGYFAASRSLAKAERMAACFAEDAVSYDPLVGVVLRGRRELHQFCLGVSDLFEEVGLREDFVSINGNEVAARWTGRGIGKNGRVVTFEGIHLFEFNAKGQIQSLRAYWNPAAMMAQLRGAA
jgi:steroid delta-isomerase